MKKLLLLLSILFLSSCAGAKFQPEYKDIHKDFKPYVDMFVEESGGKVTYEDLEGVTIGFKDYPKGSSVVGTCWPMVYFTEIDIDRSRWNGNHSYAWRKSLLYHELGHCVLRRHHTKYIKRSGFIGFFQGILFDLGVWKEKGYLSDRCPESLMHPYMFSDDCYYRHSDYYIKELFSEQNSVEYIDDTRYVLSRYRQDTCGEPKVVNKTTTWTKRDRETLERSKLTCKHKYDSCLSVFTKKSRSHYTAVCK